MALRSSHRDLVAAGVSAVATVMAAVRLALAQSLPGQLWFGSLLIVAVLLTTISTRDWILNKTQD